MTAMDERVVEYIQRTDPKHRPLFDRFHGLIKAVCPNVEVSLSYGMPTYCVGVHRLHVGVWKHGLSIYGWGLGRSAPFAARHPISGRAEALCGLGKPTRRRSRTPNSATSLGKLLATTSTPAE